MRNVIKNFKRKELFEHYNKNTNPFAIVTTKINITKIVQYCKIKKHFYATFGYIITKTVNEIDNFRYRYENNEFILYDQIRANFTDMIDEETIGFFSVPYQDSFEDFIKEYILKLDGLKQGKINDVEKNEDEIWMSCEPWFSCTSLIPPFHHDNTIPQFIWDKIEYCNNKYEVNLMIMVHHGFADGSHIGKFIHKLNENIDNWNKM